MDDRCPAFGAVGRIGVNSLRIPAIRGIIDLGTRLGIARVHGSAIREDILVRRPRHLGESLLLLVGAASRLEIGRRVGMIRAAHIGIPATNNPLLRVEREILRLIDSRIDLVRPRRAGNTHLFITGILYDFIGHTFAQEGARDIFHDVVLFGRHTCITTTLGSSKDNTAGAVNKPDGRAGLIRRRRHEALTPVFDGSWFEGGMFNNILGLRKLAALRIAAEIVQRVSCRRRTVLRRSGITGKYASGGGCFCGTDCDPHCSKIERP